MALKKVNRPSSDQQCKRNVLRAGLIEHNLHFSMPSSQTLSVLEVHGREEQSLDFPGEKKWPPGAWMGLMWNGWPEWNLGHWLRLGLILSYCRHLLLSTVEYRDHCYLAVSSSSNLVSDNMVWERKIIHSTRLCRWQVWSFILEQIPLWAERSVCPYVVYLLDVQIVSHFHLVLGQNKWQFWN